jgi:uncharacterized membrane protein YsdA (DUF1294 family)
MLSSEIGFKYWLLYLLLINIISFGLIAWDKRRSQKGARRIRERDLLLFAVIGGSLGGLMGMYTFRHKTRHLKFRWGIPFILLLQVSLFFLWKGVLF